MDYYDSYIPIYFDNTKSYSVKHYSGHGLKKMSIMRFVITKNGKYKTKDEAFKAACEFFIHKQGFDPRSKFVTAVEETDPCFDYN